MPDLMITDAEIAAATATLRAAAQPVVQACPATAITGSSSVDAALGDTESLIAQVCMSLATVADTAADDTEGVGTGLGQTDTDLAGAV